MKFLPFTVPAKKKLCFWTFSDQKKCILSFSKYVLQCFCLFISSSEQLPLLLLLLVLLLLLPPVSLEPDGGHDEGGPHGLRGARGLPEGGRLQGEGQQDVEGAAEDGGGAGGLEPEGEDQEALRRRKGGGRKALQRPE